ncbi:High-affinity nitrate transporter 2.1 [Geranomyces michiganensis]|nr:High-affinity nitrate transporter 2.1 [Geranomyces michiganensis]
MVPLDIYGRATRLQLSSLSSPHMRAFHISWLAFFAAFTSWFALNPLLKSTIGPDIGLTAKDISATDIANVASTIFFRLLVGLLTDRYGPKLAMATILILGPIPMLCVGFVKNVRQLAIVRTFVGLLGSSFVPCQYWTTAFFSPNVVGTANGIAGGWGNMGGGATFLLMPNIFSGFVSAGLTPHVAWRVSLLVPAAMCWSCALLCIVAAPRLPSPMLGNIASPRASTATVHSTTITVDSRGEVKEPVDDDNDDDDDNNKRDSNDRLHLKQTVVSKSAAYLRGACSLPIVILMLQYACSFGVELSIDSVIGSYLQTHFGLGQSMAGNIGSIFGLMNFFARAAGGQLSDRMHYRFGLRGRIGIQMMLLLLNGVCLAMFSFATSLPVAIIIMVLFSFFTESTCGSTFGIVPQVAISGMGVASGLVGAGGTAGGALFNVLFHHYVDAPQTAFRIMGAVVFAVGMLSLALRPDGTGLLLPRARA